MANDFRWVMAEFYYKSKPTIYTYLEFKFYHFKFFFARDEAIESTYFTNLERELLGDLELNKSVNVFSNIDIQILEILRNHHSRNSIADLFKKDKITKGEIDDFLSETLDYLTKESLPSERIIIQQTKVIPKTVRPEDQKQLNLIKALPPIRIQNGMVDTRSYIIAIHIFFEVRGQEEKYKSIISLFDVYKNFIEANFNIINPKLSDQQHETYFKYSYKEDIQSRIPAIRGQVKKQLRQIIRNPLMFGNDVCTKAEKILASIS